jgi:hypothetical protein
MSVYWNGRAFVKNTSGAARRAIGSTATKAVNTFNAGPAAYQQQPSKSSQQDPDDDEDLRAFRQWQNSRGGWGSIGTHKYWKDPDDAARSLGGIGVDYNRQEYTFRDIRPRTGNKKFNFGRKQQEEGGDEEESQNLAPPTDPEGERERLGLRPGGQPFGELGPAGRSHNLTDVRDVQYAGEEIGNGQQKALGTGTSLNFQEQLEQRREVINASSRELPAGESHTDQHRQKSRQRTARQNDLMSRDTPAGNNTPWSGGRRIPGLGVYGAGLANENMDEHYEGKPLPKSATGIGQPVDTGRSAPNNNAGIGLFGRTPSETDNTQNAGVGLFGKTASGPDEPTPAQNMEPLTQPTYTAPRNMPTSRRSA